MSAVQALMMSYANPMIVVDAADFDGTNDSMARGAGLTGAADSKRGILSCWVRLDGGNGVTQFLVDNTSSRFLFARAGTSVITLQGQNAAGSTILNLTTTGTYTAGATWMNLLSSWDLATAGASSLYVNDVSDKNAVTFTDDTIDYTVANWYVGIGASTVDRLNGCLAELYFAPGQYLDFSLVANRRKYISASGKPVHLGLTGALPTGTAPLVYQHLNDAEAVANFATNRGTGGDFTITGTLDTGSTSPSD